MAISHLSTDLVEVYTTYKKTTNEIIEWLLCAGTRGKVKVDKSKRPPVLTAGEFRYLADRVVENGVLVPDTILRSFRLTIEARETMSCYYQKLGRIKDETADDSHTFFNILLKDIYRDLRGEKKMSRRSRRDSGTACHVDFNNTFECLVHNTDDSEAHQSGCAHQESMSVIEPNSFSACKQELVNASHSQGMKKDNLEECMNICTYLIQIEELSQITVELFTQTGEGEVSLAAAGLITNVVYQCSESLSKELQRHGILTPSQLQERHRVLIQSREPDSDDEVRSALQAETQLRMSAIVGSFQKVWQSLSAFKMRAKANLDSTSATTSGCGICKMSFQDPIQCLGLQVLQTEKESLETACLEAMLSSLHAHIHRVRESQPTIRFRTPLLRDLNDFMHGHDTDLSLACHLSFGLHILIVSYKSYLIAGMTTQYPADTYIPSNVPRKIDNPRIQSLRFASDVKTYLETMMSSACAPCECLRVNGSQVAQHLKNFHFMLQDYVRTPRFDLLAQSPWIAGQHMLDHLMLTLKYGLQGWHHGYFVGLVLHVYNALVQAGVLESQRIPVLEGLCSQFEEPVFMGSRASPNAYSCYKRWTGGRVKFSNHNRLGMSSKQSTTAAASKKWNMCSVPDASHGGDQKQRSYSASKMSLFSLLAEGCHFLDGRVFKWTVHGHEPYHNLVTPHTELERHRSVTRDVNLIQHVRNIRDVLTVELRGANGVSAAAADSYPSSDGRIPSPARLNPFKFYTLCLQTLGLISDRNHPDPKDQGILCRCMPERCLRTCEIYHAEMLIARRAQAVLMKDREACESCRDVLIEIFGNLTWADITWSGL